MQSEVIKFDFFEIEKKEKNDASLRQYHQPHPQ